MGRGFDIGGCLSILFFNGLFMLGGLIMLGVGVYFTTRGYNLMQNGEVTVGTIIRVVRESSADDSGDSYKPEIQFEAPGGVYTFISNNSSSWPNHFRVGETVEVLYNPDDPNEAVIYSLLNIFGWPVGVGLGGLGLMFMMFVMGLFQFYMQSNKTKTSGGVMLG